MNLYIGLNKKSIMMYNFFFFKKNVFCLKDIYFDFYVFDLYKWDINFFGIIIYGILNNRYIIYFLGFLIEF